MHPGQDWHIKPAVVQERPLRWWGWSVELVKRGWESQACLVWGRDGFGEGMDLTGHPWGGASLRGGTEWKDVSLWEQSARLPREAVFEWFQDSTGWSPEQPDLTSELTSRRLDQRLTSWSCDHAMSDLMASSDCCSEPRSVPVRHQHTGQAARPGPWWPLTDTQEICGTPGDWNPCALCRYLVS